MLEQFRRMKNEKTNRKIFKLPMNPYYPKVSLINSKSSNKATTFKQFLQTFNYPYRSIVPVVNTTKPTKYTVYCFKM